MFSKDILLQYMAYGQCVKMLILSSCSPFLLKIFERQFLNLCSQLSAECLAGVIAIGFWLNIPCEPYWCCYVVPLFYSDMHGLMSLLFIILKYLYLCLALSVYKRVTVPP